MEKARSSQLSVLESLAKNTIYSINCMCLCRVEQVDVEKLMVKLQPLGRILVNGKFQDRPPLINVPLSMILGGKSYISMPVQAGDMCLAIFSDVEIDNILQSNKTSNPNDASRVHDLSDAVAFVGLFPQDSLPQVIDLTHVILHDPEKITLDASKVDVQGSLEAKELHAEDGYSGTFSTGSNRTITVKDGVITRVV